MRRGPRSGSPASLLVGSVPGARAERWTCTGAGTRSGTRCFRLTVVMRASFFYGQRFYSIYPGSRYTIFRGFLSWFCFGYRIRSAQGRPAEGCASDAGVRTLPCHPVVLSPRRPVVPSSRRPVVPSSRQETYIISLSAACLAGSWRLFGRAAGRLQKKEGKLAVYWKVDNFAARTRKINGRSAEQAEKKRWSNSRP